MNKSIQKEIFNHVFDELNSNSNFIFHEMNNSFSFKDPFDLSGGSFFHWYPLLKSCVFYFQNEDPSIYKNHFSKGAITIKNVTLEQSILLNGLVLKYKGIVCLYQTLFSAELKKSRKKYKLIIRYGKCVFYNDFLEYKDIIEDLNIAISDEEQSEDIFNNILNVSLVSIINVDSIRTQSFLYRNKIKQNEFMVEYFKLKQILALNKFKVDRSKI